MPNVIDLFAGAGGLSLGAARAGFNISAAVEVDTHAMDSHRANFPHAVHIQRDIMTLNGQELLRLAGIHQEELTGIIGGPPCQGFSSIGHGNVNDFRNRLFVKFFELIEDLQPTFFLAENVPGIMNSKYDDIRNEAFGHVANYNILDPICVKANEYGAPTTRMRYFFVGYLLNGRIEPIISKDIIRMQVCNNERTNVRKALEGLPGDIRYRKKNSSGLKKLTQNYSNANAQHEQSDFFYQRVTGMIPYNVGNQEYINTYQIRHIVNGFYPTKHATDVRARYARLAMYAKDKRQWIPNKVYTARGRDSRYNQYIVNVDAPYQEWTFSTLLDAFATENGISVRDARKVTKDNPGLIDEFVLKHADSVIRTARPDMKNVGKDIQALVEESKTRTGEILFLPREGHSDIYLRNGERILFYKDKLKFIDGEYISGEPLTTLWDDILSNNLHNEGGVAFPKGKKPEHLIKRILELSTKPGDLVLDSFLGSGTTAAVAHKMGRRWIGVELGEQAYTHCKVRLDQVIDGEQGGISKGRCS